MPVTEHVLYIIITPLPGSVSLCVKQMSWPLEKKKRKCKQRVESLQVKNSLKYWKKKSSKKINSMYHITSVFWHYILAKNATLTIKSDWRKLQRNRTVYIYVLFNNFQNSSCWRISASSLPISLSLRWAHTVRDNKWVLSPQSHLVSQYPHRRATSGPSHLPEPCFGRTARFSTRRNCTLSPSQCKRLWVSHLDLLPLLHSCRPSVTECFLPVVLWFWQDHPHGPILLSVRTETGCVHSHGVLRCLVNWIWTVFPFTVWQSNCIICNLSSETLSIICDSNKKEACTRRTLRRPVSGW